MKKLYILFYIIFFISQVYNYPLLLDFNSISSSYSIERYRWKNFFISPLSPAKDVFYNDFRYLTSKKKESNNLVYNAKFVKEFAFKSDSDWFNYKKWKIDSSFPSDLSLYYLLNKKWSTALTYLNLSKRKISSPKYSQEPENFNLFFKTPANGLDCGLYLTSHSLFLGFFAGMNIGMSCGIGYNKEIGIFKFEYIIAPYAGFRSTLHF